MTSDPDVKIVCDCTADKDNLHRIMVQLVKENTSDDRSCPLVDAAASLDVSDDVLSADLLSFLFGALTTTVPCLCSLALLVMEIRL